MTLTFKANEAARLLKNIMKIIPSVLPTTMTECVLIEQKANGKITLRCTSTEQQLEGELPYIKVESPNNIVVNVRQLNIILAALGEKEVTLTEDSNTITLSWKNGHSTISKFDPNDFPMFKEGDMKPLFVASNKDITVSLTKAMQFTDTDKNRPVMLGVNLHIEGENINIVATDAKKIFRRGITMVSGTIINDCSIIIPKQAAEIIKSYLSENTDGLAYVYSTNEDKTTIVVSEQYRHVFSNIEGVYPNWQNVLNKEVSNKVIVDRKEFLECVKRIGGVNQKPNVAINDLITIKITEDTIILKCENTDANMQAEEIIACKYDDDDLIFGMSCERLSCALSSIATDKVALYAGANEQSISHILPIDEDKTKEDITIALAKFAIKEQNV